MIDPIHKIKTLALVVGFLAMPLPPVPSSYAEGDGEPLQPEGAVKGGGMAAVPNDGAGQFDEAALEARVTARVRQQLIAEVDGLATNSIARAMRRLRDGGGVVGDELIGRPLGKGLRLTFELQPKLAGAAPVSVVTRRHLYSAFTDTLNAGTGVRLNVAGELVLKGGRQERVLLDFSAMVQFDSDGEIGSSGAAGSAELVIGQPEVLMSVGTRKLVLTVEEISR